MVDGGVWYQLGSDNYYSSDTITVRPTLSSKQNKIAELGTRVRWEATPQN